MSETKTECPLPPLIAAQKFTTRTIARSQIKRAAYNPRRISPQNKARLRKSIAAFGLVETPVWNERTGNLVGANKRLSILDTLSEAADYSLTVAVVNLSDEEEKALNIALNVRGAQGEFIDDALEDLLAELKNKVDVDLAELLAADCKPPKKESKKLPASEPSFEVIVKCADETEQRMTLEALTLTGYQCRARFDS